MTAKQQVVWTVLPQGAGSATTLRITVLVSPRLGFTSPQANQTVSQFPDWLDWPKTLSTSTFHLVVDGNTAAPITIKPKAGPDSMVWAAMVAANTPVDDFAFTDLRPKTLLSYPVKLLADTIESAYAAIGVASPSELPTKAQMPPLVTQIGDSQSDVPPTTIASRVLNALKTPSGASPYYTQPLQALQLLGAYHRPLNTPTTQTYTKTGPSDPRETVTWNNYNRTHPPTPAQLVQSIDFHKIVTSVIDHHDLARWMGMVLDIELPFAAVPVGSHTLELRVQRGINPSPDIYPPVQVQRTASDFFAQPMASPNPLTGRFLNVAATGLDLVQLDVDGGGLKLQNFAQALPHLKATAFNDQDFSTPTVQAGTPSLRTAGLMLAQARRDLAAQQSFDVNGALQDAVNNNKPLPVLHAEDLVRGYRIDIQDLNAAPGQWRSLMQRTVTFGFLNNPSLSRAPSAEEGMMRLAGGSSTDGANPDVLKIHEGVFVWRGWSLVAPEPFQALGKDNPPLSGAPVQDPQGDPPPAGLPLKTNYAATPGTLPTLRFGRRYQVRVRAVDLSGESLPPGAAANQPVGAISGIVTYRRYEPVAPPALALPSQGGTPVAMADGESMGIAAVRSFNDTPAQNTVVNVGRASRMAAAPRVSVRFAEPHGAMDTPAGKLDAGAYAMLLGHDKDLAVTQVGSPQTAYAMAEVGAPLPYLPDPMAIGVAIRIAGLVGVDPTQVFKIPLYGAAWDPTVTPNWPNALTFEIVGSETVAAPTWAGAQRIFGVPLAKGERAILRISSIIAPSRLGQMQLAALIGAAAGPNQAAMLQTMQDGQHWMLTPWTTLTLVHAVQKPLVLPDITDLDVERNTVGALDALLSTITPLSAHSTGRVDMYAEWNEPQDDPQTAASATGPAIEAHTQNVFERLIARGVAPVIKYVIRSAIHPFHDTRYRRVIYALGATSRYREYMTDHIRKTVGSMSITSQTQRRWIPSTAPPPPPNLLYVIPTFGWSRQGSGAQQVSLRAGGGLRVYLDRPWFATGFGEMLAVVLSGPEVTPADLDGSMKTHVTQWGRDPAWTSAAVSTPAPDRSAATFPLAHWSGPIGFDASGGSVPLPASVVSTFQAEHADLPPGNFQVTGYTAPSVPAGKTVQIAPHAVGYDTDRQLWYCDIVIRPPDQAYYPFIRLALARFQPTSAPGANLSQIVTSEFVQLSPDRLAIVTRTVTGISTVVNVSIYGFAPADSRAPDGSTAGLFAARTQVLDAGADPDLGWRDLAGQPKPIDQSAPSGPVRSPKTPALPAPSAVPSVAQPANLGLNYSVPASLQAQFGQANLGPAVSAAGLQGLLGPGLLWSWQGYLPGTPAGGQRRVLITESESYVTGEANPLPRGQRIIYAEGVEI